MDHFGDNFTKSCSTRCIVKLHCVREKSKPHTIFDRIVKFQRILTKLCAQDSEYVFEELQNFLRKKFINSGVINSHIANVFLHTHYANGGRGKIPSRVISSLRTPTDKISTATPMFSRSACSMVLSMISPEVAWYGNRYGGRPMRK